MNKLLVLLPMSVELDCPSNEVDLFRSVCCLDTFNWPTIHISWVWYPTSIMAGGSHDRSVTTTMEGDLWSLNLCSAGVVSSYVTINWSSGRYTQGYWRGTITFRLHKATTIKTSIGYLRSHLNTWMKMDWASILHYCHKQPPSRWDFLHSERWPLHQTWCHWKAQRQLHHHQWEHHSLLLQKWQKKYGRTGYLMAISSHTFTPRDRDPTTVKQASRCYHSLWHITSVTVKCQCGSHRAIAVWTNSTMCKRSRRTAANCMERGHFWVSSNSWL